MIHDDESTKNNFPLKILERQRKREDLNVCFHLNENLGFFLVFSFFFFKGGMKHFQIKFQIALIISITQRKFLMKICYDILTAIPQIWESFLGLGFKPLNQ